MFCPSFHCFLCPGDLSWVSCPGCPFPGVLSHVSCPQCAVQGVLSMVSCPGFPVLSFMSWLSCPVLGVPFWSPVLGVLSQVFVPVWRYEKPSVKAYFFPPILPFFWLSKGFGTLAFYWNSKSSWNNMYLTYILKRNTMFKNWRDGRN